MNPIEDRCDRCGDDVPNGSGYYPEDENGMTDDRLCRECFNKPASRPLSNRTD